MGAVILNKYNECLIELLIEYYKEMLSRWVKIVLYIRAQQLIS